MLDRLKSSGVVAIIWLSALLIFLQGANSTAFAQDKIVAIVNNEAITQKDFTDFLNFMRLQLSQDYSHEKLEEEIHGMQPDLLQKLIEDRLIMQEARKNDIKIDKNKVKSRMFEIISRYPDEPEFNKALNHQGLSRGDLEKKIVDSMLMNNIVESKVRHKVTIRPGEITSFYQQNKDEFSYPQEWHLDLIILEDEFSAKEVSYGLMRGEKLEDLATRYAFTINELKVNDDEELKPDIKKVIYDLSIGEVSAPVKNDLKYYVFRLQSITPPRKLSLSESQEKAYSLIYEKKMQEELKNWLDELKKESYIKILP